MEKIADHYPEWLQRWIAEPWFMALCVLLLALLVARLVDGVICRAVLRLTRKTATDLDERIVELLHRPIFISVVLIGVFVAAQVLQIPPWGFRLIAGATQTLAILIWIVAILRLSVTLLERFARPDGRFGWINARTLPLLNNVVKLLVVGLAVYFLLVAWQLDVGPWLASAGVLGLALGFAAKDSLANLFGGLFVIMDAPYKIGDFINLDSGERGQVTQIGLRSTRLLTRDDVEITIPNASIAVSKIVNESGGPSEKTRVAATVGVAYGSDIARVKQVLLAAARANSLATDDPEPRVRFVEMGESALIFRVLVWIVEPVQRGLCLDELNTSIYNALAEAKIPIPFPQRDVHLHRADAG